VFNGGRCVGALPSLSAEYPGVERPPELKSADDDKFAAGWKTYIHRIFGPQPNYGDELMIIAITESLNVSIRTWSSGGELRDRKYAPSNASGAVPVLNLGHIVEWHYRSVV